MSYNFNSNQRQQLLNFLNNNYGQRYSPTTTVQVDTPSSGMAINTNVYTPTSLPVSTNLANTASISISGTSNAYTPSCMTYTASIPVTGTSNAQTPLVCNTQCVAKTSTNYTVTGTFTVTTTFGPNLTNSELWLATMNKIMSDYPKGDLSTDDLKSLLKLLNIDVQETTSGDRTVITFSAYGKSYMVSCTKTAAKSGVDTKRVTTYTKSYIQDYLGIKNDSIIERFFDVVSKTNGSTNLYTVKEGLTLSKIRSAIIKENYLSGAVGEAKTEASYKTNLTKIQESTSLTAENVNSNENNLALINKLAQDFSSGNLSTTVLRSVLSAIGITPKVELKNPLYTVSFKFDGKQYSISCNADAAQKSFDDKNVATVDIQYLNKQYGLSENLLKQLADMGHLNSVYSCDGRTLVYSYNPEEFSSKLEESLKKIFNSENNHHALLEEYVMTMASNLSDYMLKNYGYSLPEDLFANETHKEKYFFKLFVSNMNIAGKCESVDYQTVMSDVAIFVDNQINFRNDYILNEFLNNYELLYKSDDSRDKLSGNYFSSASYSNFVKFVNDVPEIKTETVENVIDKLVPLFAKGDMQLDMLKTLLQACKIEPQIIEDDEYVSVNFIFNGDSYTINCTKSAIKSCVDNYEDGYVIGECPNVNIYDADFIKRYYGYTQAELDALVNIGVLRVATAKNGVPETYSIMTQEEYYLSDIEAGFATARTSGPESRVNQALYHDGHYSSSIETLQRFLKTHNYDIWNANEGSAFYDLAHKLDLYSNITFEYGSGTPSIDIDKFNSVDAVIDLFKKIADQKPPYRVYIGTNVTDIGLENLTNVLDAWTSGDNGARDTFSDGSHFYNKKKGGPVHSDTIINLKKYTMDKLVYENHTNETLAALLDERFSTEYPDDYDNRFLNCDIDLRTLLDTISLSSKSLDDVYTELLDKANQIFTKRKGLVNSLAKAGINEDTINKLKLGRFATQMYGLSNDDADKLCKNLVEIAKYYQDNSEESIKAEFAKVYKDVTGEPINSDMLNSIDAKKLFISTVNNYDLSDDILVNLYDVIGISAFSVDAAAQQSALVNSDSTKVLIGLSQSLLEQFLSECWENEDISSITQDDILKYINQSLSDINTISTLKTLFGEDVDFSSNFYAMIEQTLASLLNKSIPEMRKALCNGGIELVTIADEFKKIQSADSTTGTSAKRAADTRSTQNTQEVRPYKNPFTNGPFNQKVEEIEKWIKENPVKFTIGSTVGGGVLGAGISAGYAVNLGFASAAGYAAIGGTVAGAGLGYWFADTVLDNGFRNTVDDIVKTLTSDGAEIFVAGARGTTSVVKKGKLMTDSLDLTRRIGCLIWKAATQDGYGKKFYFNGALSMQQAAGIQLFFDIVSNACQFGIFCSGNLLGGSAPSMLNECAKLQNFLKKCPGAKGAQVAKEFWSRITGLLDEILGEFPGQSVVSMLGYKDLDALLVLFMDPKKLLSAGGVGSISRLIKGLFGIIKEFSVIIGDLTTGTSSSSSSPLTAADVNEKRAAKTGSDGLTESFTPPSDTSYTASIDPVNLPNSPENIMDALMTFLSDIEQDTTSTECFDAYLDVSNEYDKAMLNLQIIVRNLISQGLSEDQIKAHPDYIKAQSDVDVLGSIIDTYSSFDGEVLATTVITENTISKEVLEAALSESDYPDIIKHVIGNATTYSEILRRIQYYISHILYKK